LLALPAAGGEGDAQRGDFGAGGQRAQFDVAGQVPGQLGGGDVAHGDLLW
jgi:hypothetical protein